MNNSDNNKVGSTATSNSGWLEEWITGLIRYLGLLFYVGLLFNVSFSIMHIFFDEFAATLLSVLVVYLMYDLEVRPKLCLPK